MNVDDKKYTVLLEGISGIDVCMDTGHGAKTNNSIH